MKVLTRAALTAALALSTGLIAASGALATAGCTDSWKTGTGGAWDTGSNWSKGSPPGAADTACITAAGTYTVVLGNETKKVANLTVGGGSGSAPTLQIGNSGSGYPFVTVTGAVTTNAGATISDGFGDTFTAGSVTNAGSWKVPNSGYGETLDVGNFTNTGMVAVDGGATIALQSGTTFDNAGGTITNTAGSTVAMSGGTLQLDSGGLITNAGEINQAGRTLVNGGTICGTPLGIGEGDGGTGGTLQFATTSGTGPSCSSGIPTDQVVIYNVTSTLSGTIPSLYTVAVGDGGSSYFALSLSGNVINNGTFEPGWGGTVTSPTGADQLTNNGTVLVPASDYTTHLNNTIVNQGQLHFQAPADQDGEAWTNATTGTITVDPGVAVTPTGSGGSFTQSGLITNKGTLATTGTMTVNGGSVCGGPLALGVDGGSGGTLNFATKPTSGPACPSGQKKNQIFMANVTSTLGTNIPKGYTVLIGDGGSSYATVSTPGALTVAGAVNPGWGATLTVNGGLTVTGKLTVPTSGYETYIDATSLANKGTATFSKKETTSLTGALNNSKAMSLLAGAELDVTGNFSQVSTGKWTEGIASASSLGLLNVSGSSALAGTLALSTSGLKPTAHESWTPLTAASRTGTFSTVTGTTVGTHTLSVAYSSTGFSVTSN
jgi:hypothetical protein